MTVISIIIPVYNADKYLMRCVDSCIDAAAHLQDSRWDVEVVCVNDGSTDNSAEILNECSQKYGRDRICVLNQANSGVVTARKTGICSARGEWLCFVDADDWLDANSLVRLTAAIKDDVDIVVGDHTLIRGNEKVYRKGLPNSRTQTGEAYVNDCLKYGHGYIWGKLIRSSLCREMIISPFYKLNEDLLINVITGLRARFVARVDANVYFYFWDLTINREKCPRKDSFLSVLSVNKDVKNLIANSSKAMLWDGYVPYVIRNASDAFRQPVGMLDFTFYRNELRHIALHSPCAFWTCARKEGAFVSVLFSGLLSVRLAQTLSAVLVAASKLKRKIWIKNTHTK